MGRHCPKSWGSFGAELLGTVQTNTVCVARRNTLTKESCRRRFFSVPDDVDDKTIPWDGAQIVKFQDVLRKYPRTLESQERWRLIAIDMNKSVDACKHAFREIAASIRTGQPLSIAKVNLIQESSNMTVT